ncbi:MAG: HAD-IG family 5'-nucleotidase [Polyangiaceae bacterium]|nr:HAD-IG family 5'-nucleotidase [Polyangiaceae bacterium]
MEKVDNLTLRPPPGRDIFTNRTLNLRSIKAIGYDMDYTLVHYKVEAWERRAYEYLQNRLFAAGFPVANLTFDPNFVIRGLILDIENGNVVKANRFGYVKRAFHGTKPMDYEAQRRAYSRTIIDLSDHRYVFLNTLFSLSEACMYCQLVDALDEGKIHGALGYADLYKLVKKGLDAAHMEGALKAEIVGHPEKFVDTDPDLTLALLDQKRAGKKLLLVTNSEWVYALEMMRFTIDRFLPGRMTFRDLFDVVIVGARKPEFFSSRNPLFEVTSEDGLLRPVVGPMQNGKAYFGGNAAAVEEYLGCSGDEILYVGDHIWVDVKISKSVLRWRTALVLWELEDEVAAAEKRVESEAKLGELMAEKERLDALGCSLRLELQRIHSGYGPVPTASESDLTKALADVRAQIVALDSTIAPLAQAVTYTPNENWGSLLYAGNDKSHLARQIERAADVYTSRVSNFLYRTPFAYLRSQRGTLPHEPAARPGPDNRGGDVP